MSRNPSIKDLLRSLVISATWKLGETEQAIVLVGHSFGGVIIKALVTEAQSLAGKTVESDVDIQEVMKCKNFLGCLASIVFYSVPHALENTEFEDYISGCSNTRVLQRSSLLKVLRRDGDFVREMVQLSRDFESEVPQKTKVLAFLEGQPMNKKNFLVTGKSCEGRLLSWEWHKVPKDNHFEVCRPDSPSHIGYEILLNHLRQHMLPPASQTMNDVPGTVKGQKMKGLYKEGTTVQLVRMTRELMSSLNSARGTKRKETMRELRKNIRNMKLLLHGDSEAEPVPEACAQLTLDMFHEDFIRLLIQYFPKLDLDVRKDVAQVLASLQRQQVAADYLNKNKDLLDLLVAGYDHPDMASECGAMLRECVRHQSIAQYVLDSQQNLSKIFTCVEFINLEIASNAVATLEELLTRHNSTVVDYLDKNYDWFFSEYNSKLLASPDYISRRQMVKLLGHILSSRVNVNVMRRYVSSKDNMVMVMNLLLDPTVQIEAFRVFKAFVINENNPPEIVSVLVANRSRLLRFFNNFKTEKVDVQFDQDKAQVVKEIASLSMKMDLKPSLPT